MKAERKGKKGKKGKGMKGEKSCEKKSCCEEKK